MFVFANLLADSLTLIKRDLFCSSDKVKSSNKFIAKRSPLDSFSVIRSIDDSPICLHRSNKVEYSWDSAYFLGSLCVAMIGLLHVNSQLLYKSLNFCWICAGIDAFNKEILFCSIMDKVTFSILFFITVFLLLFGIGI